MGIDFGNHHIGVHKFPLTKSLSSNGLIPKQPAMCLASAFVLLPVCYVFNISLVMVLVDWA